MNRWAERLLLRRILAGEREAYAQLVRLHHAAIYRLLVHLCRDAHLAEDLTQETFAAAWAGLDTFNGSSSLATWLHRIAYRRFVDTHRRQRHETGIEQDVAEALHTDVAGPLEHAMADEESRRLYQGLAELDPADREVLVLHYLQGLSFRQMADVLDAPGGTVKWRTSQAMGKLRTLLNREIHDGETRARPAETSGPPLAGGRPASPTQASRAGAP